MSPFNLLAVSVFALSMAGVARAATYVVDTTTDTPPILSACTDAPGDCSLRGALARANADTAADTVAFNIPQGCNASTGVCRIVATSDMRITTQTIVDGYTQPGAAVNTIPAGQGGLNSVIKIQIEASPGTTGGPLVIGNGGGSVLATSVLRGLAISGDTAVRFLFNSNGSAIEGCYLGTDATGNVTGSVAPPSVIGVFVELNRSGIVIGGNTPASRNLISGNLQSGIETLSDTKIQGNLIGTRRDGLTALPNGADLGGSGIRMQLDANSDGSNPLIGGTAPGTGNVISGNRGIGIRFAGAGVGTSTRGTGSVFGNWIGVAADGVTPLGNVGQGISIDMLPLAASPLRIGDGTAAGENLIAYSQPLVKAGPADGIGSAPGNLEIGRNRFVGNAGLAINGAAAAGRDANDPGDGDVLPRSTLQNFPEISALTRVANDLQISYRVDSSTAASGYPLTIDFYRAAGDEGVEFLGSDIYTAAEAQTVKAISLAIPAGASFNSNDVLIARASDVNDQNSEFSYQVISSLSIVDDAPDPTPAGAPYSVTVRAEAAASSPFAPNGPVRVSDGRGATCVAQLAPTATPLRAEASCELVTTGAPGTVTLTASLSALESAFAQANGANVANATAPHSVTAGIVSLELVSGNNQTAEVGTAFPQALQVRALNAGGDPVSGVQIQFQAPTSGASASFAPNPVLTGADGIASTVATAIRAGGSYTVTARVGALTQSFSLTNTIRFNTALAIVSNLPNPSLSGQAVTVTTALNPQAGGPGPTGNIAITANTGEACTITLPATSCALTFTKLGERAIQAFYSGDTNYAGSKAAFATQTVQAPPSLRIDNVSLVEGNSASSTLTFTVTLDNPLGSAVSVSYVTANDTATAPGDYVAAIGTLNFSGTLSTQSIAISVNGDTEIELDERFLVNLSAATGASISQAQGIGSILNDDQPPPPVVSINDVTVQEPVSSGLSEVLARFTVSLDRPATAPATVRVQTQDGSAQAPADYDANDFVLEFAAGDQSLPVEIFVSDDTITEGIESFTVQLSEPQGLSIGDGSGGGSIFDGGANATITVTSSADPGDGSCTPSECTLREAITLGNTLELISIGFNIPGTGPHTIRPLTPVPLLGRPIHTIDGYTQPGSQPGTLFGAELNSVIAIELNGSALGEGSVGLNLVHGATVRGLAIHSWRGAGLRLRTLAGGRPILIGGNYIGTDASGLVARGNGTGIELFPDANVNGATFSWSVGANSSSTQDRNLISGNLGDGIRIVGGSGARGLLFQNMIGLARDGSALGNQGYGLNRIAPSSAASFGGVQSVANYYCSNAAGAIRVASSQAGPASTAQFFSGNDLIGSADGTPCHNGGHAIEVGSDTDSVRGVSFVGVQLDHGTDSAVRIRGTQTQVRFNASSLPSLTTPIDLGPVGPTPNDPGDGDSGPNRLLNTPVLLSAEFNDRGDRIRIRYQVDTPLIGNLAVQFYAKRDEELTFIAAHTYLGGVATVELNSLTRLGIGTSILAQTQANDVSSELSATPVTLEGRQALASVAPVREAAGAMARFTISLDEPVTMATTLNYRTIDGTAFAASDYQQAAGTVTLTPAVPTAALAVAILNDALIENDEDFRLEVFSVSNFGIGSALTTATIIDEDRLRQDRSQYDPLDLDSLNGVEGFRIEHPRFGEANLIDLGNFDGSAGTDLLLAGATFQSGSNNRSSLYLLRNLAPPFAASVEVPAIGSAQFPRIVDTDAFGAGYLAGAAGLLRGSGQLPSITLRNNTRSVIIHGRSTPLAASTNLTSLFGPGSAEVIAGASFRTTPVGDINGDGRTDFAVDIAAANAKSAAVIFGSTGSLPTSLGVLNGGNGFTITSQSLPRREDIAVRGIGDINGDGRSELAVFNRSFFSGRRVSLISGQATYPSQVFVEPQSSVQNLPINNINTVSSTIQFETASGDFNGDGRRDVVFSDPRFNSGTLTIVFGNGTLGGIANAALRTEIRQAFPGDGLGTGLAVLDFDGNGIADLAVGAAGADQPGTRSGRVAIIHGQSSWPGVIDLANPPAQRIKFLSAKNGAGVGYRLASISDLNGDGRSELGITAPGAGRSYVFFSNDAMLFAGAEAAPPPAPQRQVFSLQNTSSGNISFSSFNELLPVGDLVGDARPDVLLGVPEALTSCPAGGSCAAQIGADFLIPGAVVNALSLFNPATPPNGTTRFRRADQPNQALSGQYAAVGDFSGGGDARADLAFLAADRASVSIFTGRDSFSGFVDPLATAQVSGRRYTLDAAADALRVAGLGDIDGDGFADVGVLRGTASTRRIEIIFGINSGAPRRSVMTAPAALQPISLARTPRLGRIRSGVVAADSFEVILGDGRRAVIFGAAAFAPSFDLGNLSGLGMYLSAAHSLPVNAATLAALGDIDGDGVADFGIAHSPRASDGSPQGRIEILRGRASWPTNLDVGTSDPALIAGRIIIRGEGVFSINGLDALRDRNADGRRELLISLGSAEGHAPGSGKAFIVHGPALSTGQQTVIEFDDEVPAGQGVTLRYGRSDGGNWAILRNLGDIDGDGKDDIAYGADANDGVDGLVRSGRAGVLRGSALPQ